MAGYQRDQLDFGVTLHRMWVNSPDELGTRDQWNNLVYQHYNKQPFDGLWAMDLWVWDMRHPDLVSRVAAGQECLLDNSSAMPGKQVVAGRQIGTKIELGVFPDGWNAERPSEGIIQWYNFQATMDTFTHEAGHHFSRKVKYPAPSDAPQIYKDATYQVNSLRPHKAHNADEDFAECFRVVNGTPRTAGCYSDGVVAALDPKLITLMTVYYWLVGNLSGIEYLNLRIDSTHIYWDKVEWVLSTNWFFWTYWEKKITGNFRVNHKWQTQKLVNGVWVSA